MNTPRAIQVLWKLVKDEKAKGKIGTIKEMDKVLGLDLLRKEEIKITDEIKKLIKEREKARKEKNFKKADKIREKVYKKGFIIEDTEKGPSIIKK